MNELGVHNDVFMYSGYSYGIQKSFRCYLVAKFKMAAIKYPPNSQTCANFDRNISSWYIIFMYHGVFRHTRHKSGMNILFRWYLRYQHPRWPPQKVRKTNELIQILIGK